MQIDNGPGPRRLSCSTEASQLIGFLINELDANTAMRGLIVLSARTLTYRDVCRERLALHFIQ